MMNQLEMLTQREQLMWDIDGIVEEFACNNNISEDDMEDLIKTLCNAVCKNFPNNKSILFSYLAIAGMCCAAELSLPIMLYGWLLIITTIILLQSIIQT